MAKRKPWTAAKYKRCTAKVAAKGSVIDPNAVCGAMMWKGKKAKKK